MNLWTNRNSQRDFIRDALEAAVVEGEPVYVASAFFTDHELLDRIAYRSGNVRLIVRLGFPTSPWALERMMRNPAVSIRFFTDHSFHPKLYVFGDRTAYVGSANLTAAAMISNQEILIALGADDDRFLELAGLFGEYWEQARVLTGDDLVRYKATYDKHKADAEVRRLDEAVEQALGKTVFDNIDRGRKRESRENIFIEGFRKTYQEAVAAFNAIREEYIAFGQRKVADDAVPLRIEIDSFFSFVRDEIAVGESWLEVPIGWTAERKEVLRQALWRWHAKRWEHLETTIVQTNYPRLVRVFGSAKSIESASDDALFQALLTLHSFHDSLRFHRGGIEGLRRDFFASNEPVHLRGGLVHLLHGEGDLVRRMADLVYASPYKLGTFGRANVQELIGWHNNRELPVVNGRTTKVLRFFGFDVRQLS